jgi:hypothetical protein
LFALVVNVTVFADAPTATAAVVCGKIVSLPAMTGAAVLTAPPEVGVEALGPVTVAGEVIGAKAASV